MTDKSEIECKLALLEGLSAVNSFATVFETGFGPIQTPSGRKRQEEIDGLIAEGRRRLDEIGSPIEPTMDDGK